MENPVLFKKIADRLNNSLISSIEFFRRGRDHKGLDSFIESIADLELLLKYDKYLKVPKIKMDIVLPILKELYISIKNQDVVKITDLLEFRLCPVAKELAEGGEQQ